MTLDAAGNLELHTAGGPLVEDAPVVVPGELQHRLCCFGAVRDAGQRPGAGVVVGTYDSSKPLIIDPVL